MKDLDKGAADKSSVEKKIVLVHVPWGSIGLYIPPSSCFPTEYDCI